MGLLLLLLTSAIAKVPTALEAQFAEAVLEFHSQNYADAAKILDALHQEEPTSLDILELKALNEKLSNRPKDAEKTYLKIIKSKRGESASNPQLAPYFFEIGSLRFQEKDWAGAKKFFLFAKKHEFNLAATHFYLGMIGQKTNDLELAETHFRQVIRENANELKPPTHLYLAQLASKRKNSARAVDHLIDAHGAASKIISDEESSPEIKSMAEIVKKTALEALKPMDRSNWFGSVSVAFGYDSNVLTYPDTTPDSQAGGKRTIKGTFQSGIGYVSSPIRFLQFVPSYRNSYNYNFNDESRSAEYLANSLSLYVNRSPLSQTSYSLKVDASHLFKNDGNLENSVYRSYQLSLLAGPYFKRQFTPTLIGVIEGSIGPQTYYNDPTTTESDRRGGLQWNAKMSLQKDASHQFFNPQLTVNYQKNVTEGTEYDSEAVGGGITNWSIITDRIKVLSGFQYLDTRYNNRVSGPRKDKQFSFNVTHQFKMNQKLSWSADLRAQINRSTEESLYTYTKWTFMGGIHYSFF